MGLKLFILFFLLCCCSITRCSKCRFRCQVERHRNATCRYKSIDETPWSKKSEQSAPSPEWAKTKPFKFIKQRTNDSQKFLLRITWSQEATKIKNFVIGYYLEIKPHDHVGAGFKKRFYINYDKIDKAIENGIPEVFFIYDQFGGSRLDHIQPDTRYTITLHALPMYSSGQHFINTAIIKDVKSPSCPKNKELKKYRMKGCSIREPPDSIYPDYPDYPIYPDYPVYRDYNGTGYEPGDYIYETTTDYPPEEPIVKEEKEAFRTDIILLCVSFTSLLCLLIYIYQKWDILKSKVKLCANSNSGYQGGIQLPIATPGGRVLVLVPTAGVVGRPPEWEFTQRLATALNNALDDVTSESGGGGGTPRVECNLWSMSRCSCDPRSFLCDVITKSDFSRLVMVSAGSARSAKHDAYWAAIDYIRSGGHLRCNHFRLTTINFGDDDDVISNVECDFVKAQNRITHVTHHRMPDDVSGLMVELTGRSPDAAISTELRQLADKVIGHRTSRCDVINSVV